MKFIRVLKANNKEYQDMVQDVVDNFEKITGTPIEKIFNEPGEDIPLFDDMVIMKTFPKIKNYVLKKYDIDISRYNDFLYDLDDRLSNLYPY